MKKRTDPSILQNFDSELASLISKNRGISEMDALRVFLNSETHAMLEEDDLKLWHFSPLAIFDPTFYQVQAQILKSHCT